MRNGMPTSMMQLYGQDKVDPYGLNQGQDSGGGSGMMDSQNSQAMRNNLMGPYSSAFSGGGGGGGMSLAQMASMFSSGGSVDNQAIHDALHIARKHFQSGGPSHVGGYNFHPQFDDETDALARAIGAEGGYKDYNQRVGVGFNMNNRAWNGYHGKHSVQDILTDQNKAGTAGQYSAFLRNNPSNNIAGRNAMTMPKSDPLYQENYAIAQGIKNGTISDPTHNASNYYNPHTSHPKWGNKLQDTTMVGAHKFGTEPGVHFFDPKASNRLGDQQMMGGMQGNQLQAQPFAGNGQMLPSNAQMPQLQQTPMTGNMLVANNAPPQLPQLGMNNVPTPPTRPDSFAPDNAPLPPMRPQSAPMQSEMGWKPPAEIADKVNAHNFGDAPNQAIEAPMKGDVQFAPDAPNSPIGQMGVDTFGSMGDFGGGIGGSMGDFGDFGGGLGDIFSSLFSRGGRTHFANGGSEDLNNGALGEAAEFAPAPERRTLEEHYPKPNNGSDLYAIAHDPREEPMKRYGAMGAGMASDIAHGMWDQVKKPGEALRGEWSPTDANGRVTDEAIGWGAGTGLGMLGGGTSFSSVLGDAPAGSIGMFMGERAKNADLQALATAKRDQVGHTGHTPYGDLFSGAYVEPKNMDRITRETGWTEYGPKSWNWEIADNNAKFDVQNAYNKHVDKRYADEHRNYSKDEYYLRGREPAADDPYLANLRSSIEEDIRKKGFTAPLEDLLVHPELYDNYDHLRRAEIKIDPETYDRAYSTIHSPTTRGTYQGINQDTGNPLMALRYDVAQDPKQGLSVLLHEIQHQIQDHEKWAGKGDNLDWSTREPAIRPEWQRWKNDEETQRTVNAIKALDNSPEYKEMSHRLFGKMEGNDWGQWDGNMSTLDSFIAEKAKEEPLLKQMQDHKALLKSRGASMYEPEQYYTPQETYVHNGGEAQARATQLRQELTAEERKDPYNHPYLDIPSWLTDSGKATDYIEYNDLHFRKRGGRVGYANGSAVDGDVSYMDETDKRLPMMAESPDAVQRALSIADSHQSPHDFVQSKLFDPSDQKQLPQYDPEAGANTAKQAALTAYGMTDAGGIQQALGYMPKAEGGYEPSVADDFKGGNYLAAGLGLAGAVVPGAGKLSKAARGADAVSDATKVAQEVAAPAEKAAETFTPATPNISKSEVRNAKTIRDVLAGNGYMDHPEHALYAGALDMPAATGRTWSDLARRTNGALDEFYKMSELEQDRAFAKSAEKLAPYLQKKDGTNAELLSQNGKLAKAQGAGTEFDGLGVENWGVNLSPALQWDIVNMCGNSASCIRDCLGKVSGGYAQDGALHDAYKWNNARGSGLAKTIALMQEPEAFELALDGNVKARRAIARMNGNHLGVRSNIISDVPGILHDRLRTVNPGVSFYDYTKFGAYRPRSANHHYTYSSTGISSPQLLGPDGKPIRGEVFNEHSNWLGKNGMRDTLDRGDNVSVVVSQQNHKPTSFLDKETGRRYQAVEGDSHDFRPLDKTPDGQPGKIIVLGRKGNKHKAVNAHEKSNGFIWDYDPDKMGDTIEIPDQRQFKRKSGGKVPRKPLDDEMYRNQWANYDHYREGEPIPQEFKNPRLLFGKGKG